MLAPKVLSACWMCSVSPVSVSITVGVFLCCPGLTLMWYHMCVVVIGHAAPWEHAKPWPYI